jgi:hypothetical protein
LQMRFDAAGQIEADRRGCADPCRDAKPVHLERKS